MLLPLLFFLLGICKGDAAATLPKLSVLVTEDGKTTQFQFDDCIVELKINNGKYIIKPSEQGCRGKLSLSTLMNHFFPDNNLAQKTNTFLLPDKFDIDKLEIDKKEGTVDFSATAHERFDVIPGRLSLEGTQLAMVINYNTGEVSWPKLKLNIKGQATIGEEKVEVTLKKREDRTDVIFSCSAAKLPIPSFTKLFTDAEPDDDESEAIVLNGALRSYSLSSISSFIESADFDDVNKLNSTLHKRAGGKKKPVNVPSDVTGIEINSPEIWGKFDPAGTYEFVVSGRPVSRFFNGVFYGIVKKVKDKPVSVGILAVLDDFSPMALLEKLTGKEDLDIPILKDIRLKFVLTIANSKIGDIDHKELRSIAKEYDGPIQDGLFLQIILPLKKTLQRINPKVKVDKVAESLYVKVKVFNHKVTCMFPDTWSSDLLKALSALAPQAQEIIPNWFAKEETEAAVVTDDGDRRGVVAKRENTELQNVNVKIKKLSFKFKTKKLDLYLIVDGPISFQNYFSIENIEIKLSHTGLDAPWNFAFKSKQTIARSVTFSTKLTKNNDKYDFEGKIDLINTKQLMGWLGAKFADDTLVERFSFLNFGVENFKIKAIIDPKETFLRVSGKCTLFDWDGVFLEGIIFKQAQQTQLVLGMRLTNIRLDVIVSKLFNKNLAGVTWLTEMNVGLMISNTDSKTLKFESEEFKGMEIKRGFRFRAVVQPPDDCRGEAICEQAKSIMAQQEKKRSFVLSGVINKEGAEFKASYEGNWNIGKNVVIPSTSLVIKIGKENSIGFEIKLNIVNPKLEFTGKLALSSTLSLSLDVKMDGMWKQPFGLKYLEIGDLHLQVNYQPGAPWPGGQFGGTVIFGKIGSENAIKITIHFGLDPANPMKNFFFGKLGKLTVESVMLAFEYNPTLPQVLRETGFPKGLEISFAGPTGMQLPNRNLPGGLVLKGTINVLGLEAECDIQVTFPDKISILAKLSPLSFAGGALTVQRALNKPDEGPMFYGALTKTGTEVKIAGFASILGIESETNIVINDTAYQFYVYGSLFKVVTANLSVSAKYETADKASFQISSCISASIPDAQEEIEKTINDTTKEAKEEVAKAEEAARKANEVNREAINARDGLEEAVRKHNQKLHEKIAKYKAERNQMKVDCLLKSQTAHIGGTEWNPQCVELGDGKHLGCPVWKEDKYKILDEVAYAECKGHNAFKMWWANRKQKGIEFKFAALRALNRALRVCRQIYDATKDLIGKVKALVTKVYEAFKPVLDFIKDAAVFVLKEIVTINKLCLYASLDSAKNDACVNFDVAATLFKRQVIEFQTKGCMNVGFLKQIVNEILKRVSSGVNWIRSGVASLKNLFTSVDSETNKAKEDIKKIRKAESEEAERDDDDDDDDIEVNKRGFRNDTESWTEEDHYFARYAYELPPRMTKFESQYFSLRETKSASVVATLDDVMAKASIPSATVNEPSKRIHKMMPKDSDDSCAQITGVSSSLRDLTRKVRTLVKNFLNEKKSFEAVKNKRATKLRKLENSFRAQCLYVGCTKQQLNDVLDYVRNAKAEHDKWTKVVENQIQRQDEKTVEYWRRDFGNSIKNLYGSETSQYLKHLRDLGHQAARKMKIAVRSNSKNNPHLDEVANTLREILAGPTKISISEVNDRLAMIEPYVGHVLAVPSECNREKVVL